MTVPSTWAGTGAAADAVPSSRPLTGRVALVTGATQNLGLAIAERLVADGAQVAINGLDPAETSAAVLGLRKGGGQVYPAPADVAHEDQVEGMLRAIIGECGRLDLVVNNAAVPMEGRVPLLELDLTSWDRAFAVNTRGTFLCSLLAARWMTRHPARGQALVNISSVGATRAHRNAVAYDASKGAVEAATRAMALELAPYGIRVNAVAPGLISNDRFQSLPVEVRKDRAAAVPLGRAGSGADVAAAVSFLCSEDAAYITGQVLTVDGGLTSQARTPDNDLLPPPPAPPSREGPTQ